MVVASHGGMLSRGVLLPESRFMGIYTNMYNRPSCAMERAIVARKIPIAQAKIGKSQRRWVACKLERLADGIGKKSLQAECAIAGMRHSNSYRRCGRLIG